MYLNDIQRNSLLIVDTLVMTVYLDKSSLCVHSGKCLSVVITQSGFAMGFSSLPALLCGPVL